VAALICLPAANARAASVDAAGNFRFYETTSTKPPGRSIDVVACQWDNQGMKAAKTSRERKSPGTLAVEKYRPRMNKLTAAERERLLERAMQIAYGDAAQPAAARRR
jgi:hypothetical protein